MSSILSRAGWAAASAVLAVLFQTFLQQPVHPVLAGAVLAFTATTLWQPFTGLRLLAGFGPLSGLLMAVGSGTAGTIVLAEVLSLGFLTAWTARLAFTGERLNVPRPVTGSALFLALAAGASALVHSARAAVEMQPQPASVLLTQTLHDYVLHLPGNEPAVAAVTLAVGTLLVVAAAHLTADADRRTALLRMIICGGAAAATLNIARLAEVALRRGDNSLAVFLDLVATERVNTQYGDLNAAGSFFVLALLLTIAVSRGSRAFAVCTAPLIAAGLWISGSRFALGAAVIAIVGGVAAGAIRARRIGPRAAAVVTVALLLCAAAVVWRWYPEGRNITVGKALGIRMELARAGLEMTREQPLFGVGLGRYYVLSERYPGEMLRAAGFVRENAHNNFIQIAAELGIPGLIAFLALTGAALLVLARRPETRESLWLAVALLGFLATCIGGHPLLVPQAATAFWIALGIAAAAHAPVKRSPSRWRYAPAVLAVLLLASVWPRAVDAMRSANLEHVSEGLSRWQRAHDGTRFRFAGGKSMFYALSGSAVNIPLMNGMADRRTIEVQIFWKGREVNRLILPADDQWRIARVVFAPPPGTAFTPFELVAYRVGEREPLTVVATDEGGAVKVGRPEVQP